MVELKFDFNILKAEAEAGKPLWNQPGWISGQPELQSSWTARAADFLNRNKQTKMLNVAESCGVHLYL